MITSTLDRYSSRAQTAEMEQTVENFHGCYLLRSNSENKSINGRTYIGYTVDPNRRHKQHNRGSKHGGAVRTNNRGPWQVIVIVYGFMSNISALQFEWAWQHPEDSRRLRHVIKKRSKENALDYRLRIMVEMLCVDPWKRLPLTVQWLNTDYQIEFPLTLTDHISVLSGAVRTKKVVAPITPLPENLNTLSHTQVFDAITQTVRKHFCMLCGEHVEKIQRITCLVTTCYANFHLTCLATSFLGSEDRLIPTEGSCPVCKVVVLWVDLIRFKKGHYRDGLIEMQAEQTQILAEDVPEDAGAD